MRVTCGLLLAACSHDIALLPALLINDYRKARDGSGTVSVHAQRALPLKYCSG